jgi:hypothetical protein
LIKACFVFVSVAIALVAWTAGCAASANGPDARLGREFSLSVGESRRIQGEDLTVKFLEVTSDSRCPSKVTCIWAGEVEALVELAHSGSLSQVALTKPGLTDDAGNQVFKEYRLTFDVTPYPEAGRQISKDEYRLRLTVSK